MSKKVLSLLFKSIDQIKESLRLGQIDKATAQILLGAMTAYEPCQIITDGKRFVVFKSTDDEVLNIPDYSETDHGA